jgi:ketosteroid isomerase-like protein
MKKIISVVIISCSLVYSACNSSSDKKTETENSTAPAFDLQKARADIEAQTVKWRDALRKGDSAGVAALYASDAMVLPPNSDIVKADGIAALWGSYIRMGVKGANFTIVDVSGNADMVAETGIAEIYGPDNAIIDKAKYVVTWKMENGNWKLFRDIWNSTMPAAPSK